MMPRWKYWTVLTLIAPVIVLYASIPEGWNLIPVFIFGLAYSALLQPHVRKGGTDEG